MRSSLSVLRIDFPDQGTGQYPTFYPSGIERKGAFYWILSSFKEEIAEPVRKAPKGLKNVE